MTPKQLTWLLSFEQPQTEGSKTESQSSDIQLLYFFERPTFVFRYEETKRVPKTIRERASPSSIMLTRPDGQVWRPISIEIPTRPMKFMSSWLEYGRKDLNIICYLPDGKLFEEWSIKKASVVSKYVMMGRRISVKVWDLSINYEWAGKVHR